MKGLGGWIILAGGALVLFWGWKWWQQRLAAANIVPDTRTSGPLFPGGKKPGFGNLLFQPEVVVAPGLTDTREVGAGVGQVTPDHPAGIWIGPPASAGTYSNSTMLYDPNNPGEIYNLPPIANPGGNAPSHA